MTKENGRPGSFPLRLPISTRRQANDLAQREGLSLNQFISLAVAEKITRLEQAFWLDGMSTPKVQAALAVEDSTASK
jgi:hypothetical protein